MMKKIFTLFAALMMVFSMNAATKTIYCKMAQDWWKADGAAVGAYYWGTGTAPQWPGVRMTPVEGETDLWSIDVDTDKYQNIIFVRVNGTGTISDWGAKTADLVMPTGDTNLYTITSTSPVWGDPGVTGEWSVYTTSTPDPTPDPEPEPEPTPDPDPTTGLTYNVTVPAGTNACYIAGAMTGWTQTEMTKVDDTHYTITIAEATETMGYKYCSGPDWAYVECGADDSELADRVYSANDEVAKWRAIYDPNNVPTPPTPGETKDITVKAQVPATWTNTITAWVWPTGGEGKEVVPAKEGNWYVVTENCAELNVIFKNGEGWTGDANQTVDMTFTESTCISIAAGDGKATYTVVDCEENVTPEPEPDPTPDPEPTTGLTYNVTVPAGTKACYIAGAMTGWSQTEMTKVDDTHYTITIAEATETMGYKYCSGPDWAYVECGADDSELADRVYSANDEVAKWRAIYDPNNVPTPPTPGETKDITVKAQVPATWTNTITAWVWPTGGEGKEVVPAKEGNWYVVTENCAELNIIFKNGAGWNGDANQTVDITGITESTCFEITAGEGKATYTVVDCPEGGNEGGNEGGETPVTGVTYNVTVPAGTNACYIAGEMNTWTHQEMTKVDDTHYTLTIAEATTTMKYKYCSGPGWAYVEKTATGDEVADRTHTENDVVEAWAAVYDPNNVPSQGETKDITVKAKVPATWTDQITAWVWATGGEGTEVVPAQEGEWYVYTQNCAELNIIFKNGAGWNGDANQTVDITGITESTCIEITADGVTKATYTVVDCEGGDTPVDPTPGETKTIYLNTGGAQLWNQADAKFFVHAWGGAADLDAQMTLVAGDIYQVEIAHTFIIFLRLAPAATGVVWEGENLWNKTADLEIPEGMNCYTITGWEPDAGTWSSYTPVDGPTTDNEQVVINKKATKIVYNGQICIIRDGVMFNILGQVIK